MPRLIVKAATATGVQPPYALFLGGTDVLKGFGGAGNFGVPIETIEVIEAGPGGVSSMFFTIDDPANVIALYDGMEVRFWDFTADRPLFRGYVDHAALTPDFGGQGKRIVVSATGVEAWLDWLPIYPAYVHTSGVDANLPSQILLVGLQLNSPLFIALGLHVTGERFAGISNDLGRTQLNGGSWTIPAGTTYREFIRLLFTYGELTSGDGLAQTPLVTVDFDMTLRVWYDGLVPPNSFWLQPFDYATLTINDIVAGTAQSEPTYTVDYGNVAHECQVIGFDAASSGLFGDGSGLRGRRITVTDTAVTTAAMAQLRATAALKAYNGSVTGTLVISDWTPPSTVHAGSMLALTDASLGLAAPDGLRLFDIRKTFLGDGRQTWVASFGGPFPSGAALIRKLTRAVAA